MSFTIYPAMDLSGGKVVRLHQGDFHQATVYDDDPLSMAKRFARAGAEWIHLVDLDAAKEGKFTNHLLLKKIKKETRLKIQIGGGLRDMKALSSVFSYGANRAIIGTAAYTHPSFAHAAAAAYSNPHLDRSVAVGIDAREGKVAIQGWIKKTGMAATDLASQFQNTKVGAIIFTDVGRDGTMKGPNILQTLTIADAVNRKIPVIASGGIGGRQHLEKLAAYYNDGIKGAILGRAYYENKITIESALRVAREVCEPLPPAA